MNELRIISWLDPLSEGSETTDASIRLISIFRSALFSFRFLVASSDRRCEQKRDRANEVAGFEVSLKRFRLWHGARFIARDGWFLYSPFCSFFFFS